MNNFPIDDVLEILKSNQLLFSKAPVMILIKLHENDPFKVLLSTIISLRTNDEITIEASKRLYSILKTPQDIKNLSLEKIEKAIYPCGFYKRKSIQIKSICEKLIIEFNSKVPDEIDTLLTFPGVGRKTANLVLSEGYKLPAICVDTHVHRISNRFGYLKSKTPDETEQILIKCLPKKYWNNYNWQLVAFGQTICRPISPHCTLCPVLKYCKRVDVKKHR